MKKRFLLICALFVSAITLSGAANRSFRTEMEQWNPIGFTQAQSGTQITRNPLMGSAILPTVATEAPSGELRGGSTNVITFTTAKEVGETVVFHMKYTGDAPTLSGMTDITGTPGSETEIICKLTSQNVTITGDVTSFDCYGNEITALDVSHNTALTELSCSENQLTTLDVSKNTKLTLLYCEYNKLAALNLSMNTKLKEFDCSDNQLTALDVSHNTALTELDCSNNQLSTLDVSKNTELTYFGCNNNQLKALDVSHNTALTALGCYSNQLTALDLSHNTALTYFSCDYNKLLALDLTHNTALKELECSNNQLTELDLTHNTALIELDCSKNQLTALDLSQNSALIELDCRSNKLTALDFSQNSALRVLYCYDNQIKGGKMTRLVNSLPDRTDMIDGFFTVVQEPAPEGNQCHKTDVAIAKGKNWNTKKINSESYERSDYEGAANVITFKTDKAVGEKVKLRFDYTGAAPTLSGLTGTPESGQWITYTLTSQTVTITGDVVFLECSSNQLTVLDVSKNSVLTLLDCSDNQLTALDVSQNTALTWLECKYNQLTTLDISHNTALTKLGCKDNQLTASDLTHNTALTKLECYYNQLTTLDVSHNTALKELDCHNNQLTALDLSHNTALKKLDCHNNQLTALNVSKNTALGMLYCYENKLTALDVSNTYLRWLRCYGNQIKGEKMTQLMNSLPDRPSTLVGAIDVVQEPAPEGNRCLKTDVAIAKGKNWIVQKYNTVNYQFSAYEGEDPIPYAVTLTKVGEGTLDATGAADLNAVPEGTELTIVATPAEGYELTALSANGTDILATKKFTVTAATEVKATFTKKTYAVTLTKEGEGTITATGAADLTAVPFNTELTINATPAEGYKLVALTANGADILATKKVVVKGATEVKATFSNKTYAVTLTKEGEGTITATGAANLNAVHYGTELTIEATPAEGYELTALTANDTDILATKKFTVTANTEVKATFTKKTYTVTLTKEGEGTITATGADDLKAVPEGTELTIKATPTAGYELTALTANGADILATKKFVVTGATEVKATFTKKTYAVTLAKEGEGTLTATGAADLNAVPEGTELTIEATPAAGYELKALTANGTDILATKKVVVKGATEVKATFTKKTAVDVVEAVSVRLYPNPASTYVNVKAIKADALVRLYDANGTLQYEARTDADGTLQIDLSAYAEGSYLLRVGNDAQRLLIQR